MFGKVESLQLISAIGNFLGREKYSSISHDSEGEHCVSKLFINNKLSKG